MNPTTAHVPLILGTGAVHEVEALSGHRHELGIRVVIKPVTIGQLLEVIAELLAATPDRAVPTKPAA